MTFRARVEIPGAGRPIEIASDEQEAQDSDLPRGDVLTVAECRALAAAKPTRGEALKVLGTKGIFQGVITGSRLLGPGERS